MNQSLAPIQYNEVSFRVAMLHKALQALGITIAEAEVRERKAGKDTRKQMRALQEQWKLEPGDDVLDAKTEMLLTRELAAATANAASFTISGTVRGRDGSPKRAQDLVAYDLDLRAIATFRTVKTAADVSDGYDFVGTTVSGSDGTYRLTFFDWQFATAERQKADIVVFAFDDKQAGGRITGRSRLVRAADYSDTGTVERLDVILADEEPGTEYERVMRELNAFLEESRVSLIELARSQEQITFTANELAIPRERIAAAAFAALRASECRQLLHELLYGIGRQGIPLEWTSLQRRREDELRHAIAASVARKIIQSFDDKTILAFLRQVRDCAAAGVLGDDKNPNPLTAMLSNALPKSSQRVAFVQALRSFDGEDASAFWSEHLPAQPEFKASPQLIADLLQTQRLTALTGNHQPLVRALQVDRKIRSAEGLLDLDREDWVKLVREHGVPASITGADEEARVQTYAQMLESTVDAAFPTQRIARMVADRQLPVATGVKEFLGKTQSFDFATSRVHKFDKEIEAIAGDKAPAVRSDLMKLQRVYQVSSHPGAMATLLAANLDSAHAIAGMSQKTFMKTYGDALGGDRNAFAIHQRATHIAMRSELAATHLYDYAKQKAPGLAFGPSDYADAQQVLANELPNYTELFGSPDICECEHCRSVYSAAAYFVDLLRFLWRGEPNSNGKTPLDLLKERRPDLLHLPLSCENTNTIIPYIDLGNEVMEYYVAHNDSLTNFRGYDTGETTAEELRANPQNFDLEAYRKLKDAKHPFTLPYHQPLDVIRTYSDHLKVSRAEAMRAMHPEPDATTETAIAAEALRISQEEMLVLTGHAFDGTADTTALHAYWGYTAANQLEGASAVPEFKRRSGIVYTDVVELIKTLFINPDQGLLAFLEELFADATISANTIYTRLEQIEAGTLDPANDNDIKGAINAYNTAHGTSITTAEFKTWVEDHLAGFRHIITLYEPESRCDLANTKLRTLESIYESSATSGLTNADWSKIHRFLRLWRKLGWTIHEVDLMLAALGEADITATTIRKLAAVVQLKKDTKLALNQLAVFWGTIDSYGDKALYRKLFLNKAVQQIDDAFQPDAWGNYLSDPNEVLEDHKSAILAAFRMREEDLAAIVEVARVVDGGVARPLDLTTDLLHLGNLSTIYRYVLLAKALRLRVPELTAIVRLFGASPFSVWDVQQEQFVSIDPDATAAFYELASRVKSAGFKASVLEYILEGTLPAESTIGIDRAKTLRVAKAVRESFAAIELDHPEPAPAPLTREIVAAKLGLTFQPDVVAQFLAILDGTAVFEATAVNNLAVIIPSPLSDKYTYVKGSGRVTATGVMSDADETALKALDANGQWIAAIEELHDEPELFLGGSFDGVFTNLAEAKEVLLDRPAQTPPATFDEKLAYVYEHFVPLLKSRLRRDAVTQHIAAVIRASEEATALLLAADVEALIVDLSTEGHSAMYFGAADWTAPVIGTSDATIDFDWGTGAPQLGVPADAFSVRWDAYIAPPASGEYTFIVTVAEADEVFRLSLDGALLLEKTSLDTATSFEIVATLNAASMHRLTLEYAEATGEAAVTLEWKTATTAPEVLPASAAYPATILDDFVALMTLYHRAAKFLSGFGLSETELHHFLSYATDFGGIDFQALDADAWRRVADYVELRNAVPQALALLTDVFAAANTIEPVPTIAALKTALHQATAWDEAAIDFLVDTHFGLAVEDFRNEIALNRVRTVVEISSRTGLSAETIAEWGGVETDFDALHAAAQLMKNSVKAKYDEDEWLDLAGNLSDTIRQNQQKALVAYLLTRPAIQAWGAEDADALFEYFLIDVQMDACMDTSRIVQANSSVQMFVNRCLLNLESDLSTGNEHGVSPGAIDRERWEWMKAYRVWEANRKVFLYPENWLEPEWRNDRSEFFRELESYLVQNDITDRSVEQAFRNYLTSLNDVANLEVVAVHRENHDDGELKYLHVFARTHSAPYKYFYRRWNQYMKWSAWERVPVDIRAVETAGAYTGSSGVHLVPVVWKKRLFLFWPEWSQIAKSTLSSETAEQQSKKSMTTLAATTVLEMRIGWSGYVDGKWTPKSVSKEFLEEWPHKPDVTIEKDFLLMPVIDEVTQELRLEVCDDFWNASRGRFILEDIQSPIRVEHYGDSRWVKTFDYHYWFGRRSRWDVLELEDKTYLRTPTEHKLAPVDTIDDIDINIDEPFFFSDLERAYFVRPVDVTRLVRVIHPEFQFPLLPGFVDDSKAQMPDIPHFGPEDYFPEDGFSIGGNPVLVDRTVGGFQMPPANVNVALGGIGRMGDAHMAPMMATKEALTSSISAKEYAWSKGSVASAFAEPASRGAYALYSDYVLTYERKLEFHTFHHPYSSEFVTRLNQGGMPGLMESDTVLPNDEGTTFVNAYAPDFGPSKVHKPSDFATRTYYKDNVCFDVYGANSQYNWELFFHAPLYIATRLSLNGRYEEAMRWFHFIFDPTTDAMPGPGESEISRYWNVLPFKTTPAESLEEWFRDLAPNGNPNAENAVIAEWRDNPFDPHLVAANRPLAYMKHVVLKYVANLIAWADSLFRQDTMESVNEALQIYVLANHILGPRPDFVPRRGDIRIETYTTLETKWDDFSNALVELENLFPYSSDTTVGDSSSGPNLLGVGDALYFCIPANEKLLESWDLVADRLFKIRHCMNIDGVERKLALFAPPIDPAALIQATSMGLSLGSILADLSSPPPIYRFQFLLQKANEFCGDVKALGAALLAALEKKDAEELGRLRSTHEIQMLELMTAIRERQVLMAKSNREQLQKSRETAQFRLQHYSDLLGNQVSVPAAPSVSATLNADSQLPADTGLSRIVTDVDESLADTDTAGVKVITKEKEEIDQLDVSRTWQIAAQASEGLAGILHIIPTLKTDGTPLGVGAGALWGGTQLGNAANAAGRVFNFIAGFSSHNAGTAAKMAAYIRREQEWTLQANIAAKEIISIDKQIASAEIQVQVAQKELENHRQSIDNAKAVEQFLRSKFTNQELYQWMKEQLFAVYKQSYNLCYDMARKAEKAFRHEMGTETARFIQYGYWDNAKQGLVSGEKLQLALRQMEKAYLDDNRRELELTKNISLARLDPLALVELRETGRCNVSLSEELFDLDFRGHYFRRIKAVRLSIPCVIGPHTSISCSLRLLRNSVRTNTTMDGNGGYEHENDAGEWIDDDRFRTVITPVTAIATSHGQSDSGMFEFNFRDERYLPFERAGAISDWQIELSADAELRQFDYSTITDVVLHLNYTAREDAGLFRVKATDYLKSFLTNPDDLETQPLVQMFSMRHEFPTEWYRFLHPAVAGAEQILSFTPGKERFPFFVQDRDVIVMEVMLLAKTTKSIDYHAILSFTANDASNVAVPQVTLPENADYGNLHVKTIDTADTALDELDVTVPMSLKLKANNVVPYTSLTTNPDEVEDLFIVLRYKLAP